MFISLATQSAFDNFGAGDDAILRQLGEVILRNQAEARRCLHHSEASGFRAAIARAHDHYATVRVFGPLLDAFHAVGQHSMGRSGAAI